MRPPVCVGAAAALKPAVPEVLHRSVAAPRQQQLGNGCRSRVEKHEGMRRFGCLMVAAIMMPSLTALWWCFATVLFAIQLPLADKRLQAYHLHKGMCVAYFLPAMHACRTICIQLTKGYRV
jgi:hypothetical protein